MNNNAPTQAQWKQLYDVAIDLKTAKPWKNLLEIDLVTIMLPNMEEPVVISTIGADNEGYSIGVYPGFRSIDGLYRGFEEMLVGNPKNPLYFQNGLVLYFGAREELTAEERETIKSLGYKFRGKHNWVFFRTLKEGRLPWFINTEEADILIAALQNFAMAYRDYDTGKVEVDFEEGETLFREYLPEQNEWVTKAVPSLNIPECFCEVQFSDELFLKRLKSQGKIPAQLEIDILYVDIPVQEAKDEVPFFPRVLLMADRQKSEIIYKQIIDKDVDNPDVVIELVLGFIEKNGKPRKIFVRDIYFERYVFQLCEVLNIPLDYGVPLIEEVEEDFANFMCEIVDE